MLRTLWNVGDTSLVVLGVRCSRSGVIVVVVVVVVVVVSGSSSSG